MYTVQYVTEIFPYSVQCTVQYLKVTTEIAVQLHCTIIIVHYLTAVLYMYVIYMYIVWGQGLHVYGEYKT